MHKYFNQIEMILLRTFEYSAAVAALAAISTFIPIFRFESIISVKVKRNRLSHTFAYAKIADREKE